MILFKKSAEEQNECWHVVALIFLAYVIFFWTD